MTDGKTTLADAFAPPATEAPATAGVREEERYRRPPSREGRKAVVVHLDPAGHRELRQMALDMDRSAQSLCVEAINDLFRKHGRASIAGGQD